MIVMAYTVDLFDTNQIEETRCVGLCTGESCSEIVSKIEKYYTCDYITIDSLTLDSPTRNMEGDPPEGLFEIEEVVR